MSDGDGKMMAQTERVSQAEIDKALTAAQEQPPGTVRRVLNFRDRNLLVGAARSWCARDDQKKLKDQDKLIRLGRLISFDETLEYMAMLTDAQEELQRKWLSDWNRYRLWRNFQAGLITADDLAKGTDIDKGVPKPALVMPENTPAEMRGPSRDFFLPSKLDAWVQDAIRGMEWNFNAAEYAVELAEKFGVEIER